MKKDGKKLLFEMMEKVNPDFKYKSMLSDIRQVDEIAPNQIAPDAAAAQKATTPYGQRANSRIDTPQEFQDGFMGWLSTTGFDPQKKPLSISQAQTLVRNAMIKLGFK
jgi:hypothetical protein